MPSIVNIGSCSKGGVDILNPDISVGPVLPTEGRAGQVHIVGSINDYQNIYIDDTVRVNHISPCLIAKVLHGVSQDSLVQDKEVSGKKVSLTSARTPQDLANPSPFNISGSVNLLQNNLTDSTKNGITCTYRDDGGILLNGVASAYTALYLNQNMQSVLQPGSQYIVSVGATMPGTSKVSCHIKSASGDVYYGHDTPFTVGALPVLASEVYIDIPANTSFNNLVIYPQLQRGSVSTKYSPYHKQNVVNRSRPIAMSKKNGVIDVENTYMHNGIGWEMIAQKGSYLLAVFSSSPYLRLMYRSSENVLTEHAALSGFELITSRSAVNCIEVSPDNKWLAIGIEVAPYMLLYYRTGDDFKRVDVTIGVNQAVKQIRFSDDSTTLAYGTKYNHPTLAGASSYGVITLGQGTITPRFSGSTPNDPSGGYVTYVTNMAITPTKIFLALYSNTTWAVQYRLDTGAKVGGTVSLSSITSNSDGIVPITEGGVEYLLAARSAGADCLLITIPGNGDVTNQTVSGTKIVDTSGIRKTLDPMTYVCLQKPTSGSNTVALMRRSGLSFTILPSTLVKAVGGVDINNNILFLDSTYATIVGDTIVDKGPFNVPNPSTMYNMGIAPKI